MVALLAEAEFQFNREPRSIGPASDAITLHYSLISGLITGPRIHLTVIPEGAGEWCTIRGDGIDSVESKCMLFTPREDIVLVVVNGVYDAGDNGYVEALDGSLLVTATANLAVRFFTSALDYMWLNKTQYTAAGERDYSGGSLGFRLLELE